MISYRSLAYMCFNLYGRTKSHGQGARITNVDPTVASGHGRSGGVVHRGIRSGRGLRPARRPGVDAPTTAPAATTAPVGQKVTITVFNRQTPSNETPKGAAADYMGKHPNVTVDWQSAPPGADLQKMLVLAAAGTPPDIQWQCLLCNYHQFILAGLVLEHDPLVKSHNYPIDTQMPQA